MCLCSLHHVTVPKCQKKKLFWVSSTINASTLSKDQISIDVNHLIEEKIPDIKAASSEELTSGKTTNIEKEEKLFLFYMTTTPSTLPYFSSTHNQTLTVWSPCQVGQQAQENLFEISPRYS